MDHKIRENEDAAPDGADTLGGVDQAAEAGSTLIIRVAVAVCQGLPRGDRAELLARLEARAAQAGRENDAAWLRDALAALDKLAAEHSDDAPLCTQSKILAGSVSDAWSAGRSGHGKTDLMED